MDQRSNFIAMTKFITRRTLQIFRCHLNPPEQQKRSFFFIFSVHFCMRVPSPFVCNACKRWCKLKQLAGNSPTVGCFHGEHYLTTGTLFLNHIPTYEQECRISGKRRSKLTQQACDLRFKHYLLRACSSWFFEISNTHKSE